MGTANDLQSFVEADATNQHQLAEWWRTFNLAQKEMINAQIARGGWAAAIDGAQLIRDSVELLARWVALDPTAPPIPAATIPPSEPVVPVSSPSPQVVRQAGRIPQNPIRRPVGQASLRPTDDSLFNRILALLRIALGGR